MTVLLANNVSSALAASITASATSMTVTDGSRFPVLSAGQYFYATIIATNGIVEIVKVNTRNGNAMSITRAQDGTNAQAFASGARVEMRINAASVRETVTDQTGPLDTRLTTAEGDITALEGRMTTAEGDIVALEAFDTALATSTGSASVGFLQAGTSATLRTVQSKLRDIINVKDFGAVGNGTTDDTAAVQAAITYAQSINGGVIYFPPAVYAGGMITISGTNVTLSGYGASLKNFRFTFTTASSNIRVEGFYVYDDTGISTRYFLEIQGNRLTMIDCTFEFINHYQALGWVRRNVSYLYFTRVRAIRGGINIFGGGTDYHFTDCIWEDGTDDAIALKAPAIDPNPLVTQNITVQGGTVRNHAAIISLGSDIGRAGADGYTAAVRNVAVSNVTAIDTTSILFIKPGIISGSDWRDGTVENVTVSNCTLTDTTGAKYKRAIDIQAGRGAIVNNVIVSNCTVFARCPAIVTDHAFVYIRTVAEGDPALIKNIFVNNCSFIDIYDGAVNGIGAPGHPTTQAVYGEQANGVIQNVVIDNCLMRGTRDSGIFCDIVDLTVRNTALQKIAASPSSTYSGFWNTDNLTQYKNVNIEALNGLAIGYTSGGGGSNFNVTAETSITALGSATAGTDVSSTAFVAPTGCYIWKIVLVNTASIAQSNTDYLQIRFYNHSTADYLIQTSTQLTGLNIVGYTGVSVNGANAFTGANAYLPKGTILSFSTVNQGAGKPLTNMYAVIHYVPYGL